jgi:hypothetical protein
MGSAKRTKPTDSGGPSADEATTGAPARTPQRRKRLTAKDYRWLEVTVELEDIAPRIWRRLLVPGWMSLRQFHAVLQAAMGWTNSHLWIFDINGQQFADAHLLGDLDVEDDRAIDLGTALQLGGGTLRYIYDLGDDWGHRVVLEDADASRPPRSSPYCTDGARACPPEDCGGVPGFFHVIEALRTPGHPDGQDMREWVGPKFDPDAFNKAQVNRRLTRASRLGEF